MVQVVHLEQGKIHKKLHETVLPLDHLRLRMSNIQAQILAFGCSNDEASKQIRNYLASRKETCGGVILGPNLTGEQRAIGHFGPSPQM